MVKAEWNGAVMAQSDATVVVEGNHYFPRDAVNPEFLIESATKSTCPWKGVASYYSISVDGKNEHRRSMVLPRSVAGRRRNQRSHCLLAGSVGRIVLG